MADQGIHPLIYAKTKQALIDNANQLQEATLALNEAVKLGDLSEASEYDAAKITLSKIRREREELLPILDLEPYLVHDNTSFIEEGCVIDITIYELTQVPQEVSSAGFNEEVMSHVQFSGVLLFGGTLGVQELLGDNIMDAKTPIGTFLMGKQSGYYSVKVPGGFSNLYVKRLKSTEYIPDDIGCTYDGCKYGYGVQLMKRSNINETA